MKTRRFLSLMAVVGALLAGYAPSIAQAQDEEAKPIPARRGPTLKAPPAEVAPPPPAEEVAPEPAVELTLPASSFHEPANPKDGTGVFISCRYKAPGGTSGVASTYDQGLEVVLNDACLNCLRSIDPVAPDKSCTFVGCSATPYSTNPTTLKKERAVGSSIHELVVDDSVVLECPRPKKYASRLAEDSKVGYGKAVSDAPRTTQSYSHTYSYGYSDSKGADGSRYSKEWEYDSTRPYGRVKEYYQPPFQPPFFPSPFGQGPHRGQVLPRAGGQQPSGEPPAPTVVPKRSQPEGEIQRGRPEGEIQRGRPEGELPPSKKAVEPRSEEQEEAAPRGRVEPAPAKKARRAQDVRDSI